MSGNFLSCLKFGKTLSGLRREGGISLGTLQWIRASTRIEGRISWFFSSYSSKLGVLLELRWGHQGPAHAASGKFSLHVSCEGPLGISLQSLLGTPSPCGVLAGTSGFLFSADKVLGVPLEFLQGSQALSRVETCKSAFLSSWKSNVRILVELT